MDRLIAAALLVGVIGIAGFGVFAMAHSGEHGGCIAAAAAGIDCQSAFNQFSFALFHLGAFKSFSSAIFGDALRALAAAAALIFLLAVLVFAAQRFGFLSAAAFAARVRIPAFAGRERLGWLALHETSPTAA